MHHRFAIYGIFDFTSTYMFHGGKSSLHQTCCMRRMQDMHALSCCCLLTGWSVKVAVLDTLWCAAWPSLRMCSGQDSALTC